MSINRGEATYRFLKHGDSPLKRLAQLRQRSNKGLPIDFSKTRKKFSGGATSTSTVKKTSQQKSKVCPGWPAHSLLHTYARGQRKKPSPMKQQRFTTRISAKPKGSTEHTNQTLTYVGLDHIKNFNALPWASKLRQQRPTLERCKKSSRQQRFSLTVQVQSSHPKAALTQIKINSVKHNQCALR